MDIDEKQSQNSSGANPSPAAIFSRMAIDSHDDNNDANNDEENGKMTFSTASTIGSCSSAPTRDDVIYKSMINSNKFSDWYRKEKRLRNGAYGIVYQASRIQRTDVNDCNDKDKCKDNKKQKQPVKGSCESEEKKEDESTIKYAVKQIDRTKLKERDDHAVFREVCILKELVDVPNVITLVDFFVEPQTLYVVLTLAAGGDVFDRLIERKTYTEQFARELAKVLLRTLSMIHERKIVHRDLKPGNLLLENDTDDCSILLADFGFATRLNADGYCSTRCGTPMYVAPEVILDVPYNQKVDMWSCGCILYMLLCGYPPFHGDHHRDLFRRIRAGNFTFHETSWSNVSIPAKQLIAHLLTVNPTHRWTAQKALDESTWFKATTTASLHLSQNDLSEALSRIRSRRKLKAAMDAVRWAATARFWQPEKVTFSQQMKKWDKSLTAKAATPPDVDVSDDTNVSINSNSTIITVSSTMPPPPNKPIKLYHFEDCYNLRRKVRKGAYATVWECTSKEDPEQVFAVKIIARPCLSPAHDEQVLNEVSILQSLSSEAPESIVQLVDFYEEEDAFYIVMEMMTGGDVFDRVVQKSCYNEKDARDLIKRLLQAVQILHKKGIAHRDIKPQNLLLQSKDNDSHIKLCDFGFARRVHTPESLTQRVGTPPYVAPEILKNIPHDERVDMWSVGVTGFVLLVGYPPFAHENREMVCQQIKAGAWSFYEADWKKISPDAKELIKGLMQVDPVERLSASEALQSKWIRQSDDFLSSRDLHASLQNLRCRRHDLREAAQKTFTWFNMFHQGFASKPITSPTQALETVLSSNDSDIIEDSIGNIEVQN